jgi:hypothetical protein
VYASHPYLSRTLDFACYYGSGLFEEETHAICLQLGRIWSQLKPIDVKLPIFPSHFLLHDDLFLQLTDLYPPAPIDEEAFRMGWFDDSTNEDFFVKIVGLLWNLNDDLTEARNRLYDYVNLTGFSPSWGKAFLSDHRKKGRPDGLPPILVLDINRAKVLDFSASAMSFALTEILGILPNLHPKMLIERLVPLVRILMEIEHDVLQSMVMLILVGMAKTIGLAEPGGITRDEFVSYMDKIIGGARLPVRYTLCGLLPDIVSVIEEETSENFIRALIHTGDAHEMAIFSAGFTPTMVALNQGVSNPKGVVKDFVGKVLGHVQLTHHLLTSLLSLPPEFYVVDTLLSRMAPQLKSQAEIRYLIRVAPYASPAMLHRFGFLYAASSNLTVSSLALVFIQRLKQYMHPVDYRMLIPPAIEKDLVHILPSPAPVDDSMLEQLRGLIVRSPSGLIGTEKKPITRESVSKQITWELGKGVTDFDFSTDGRQLFVGGESGVRVFQMPIGSAAEINPGGTPSDRIAAWGDAVFVASTVGNQTRFVERWFTVDRFDRPLADLLDVGRVTAITRSPTADVLLVGTDAGRIFLHTLTGTSDFLQMPRRLGGVSSLSFVPQTSYYTIGTREGVALLYDFRMQCPLRRMRASDRPAMIAVADPDSFWMTSGPHAAKFPVTMNQITRGFSVSQTHAIQCCCVKDCVITAHSDYSVFAFNGRSAVNLSSPTAVIHTGEEPFVAIPRPTGGSLHTAPITILKSSPVGAAPISCDLSGKIVFWSTPLLK